ncbi:MAG TPA: DUF4157 domain-containing protein [Thermoleophilaceae bacterium]
MIAVETAQRGTCACGKPLGPTGECVQCRAAREAARRPMPRSAVVEGARSSGRPLEPAARAVLEPRLGRDFSSVRVHADAAAAESARALDADAYTVGRDVVFGAGRYQPDRPEGRRLLAHELTHVAQQAGGSGAGAGGPAAGESQLESEAEAVAAGGSGAPARVSAAPAGTVQRQPAGAAPAAGAPAPPRPTNPPPLRNVGRGGNRFDAALDRSQCLLDLTVKADFKFRDVPDRWAEEEKGPWKRRFIEVVTRRWSFRHFLVPSGACDADPCPRVMPRLHVVDVSDPGGGPPREQPHLTVSVLSAPEAGSESHYTGQGPRGAEYEMGIGRISTERRERDDGRHQTTVEHEMGHHLGLSHVRCARNDPVCYGDNRYEKADIMGEGELVSTRDYEPFAEVMNQFEPACGWRVQSSPTEDRGLGWSARGMLLGGLAGLALGAGIGGVIGQAAGSGALGAGFGAMIGVGIGALLGAWLDRG